MRAWTEDKDLMQLGTQRDEWTMHACATVDIGRISTTTTVTIAGSKYFVGTATRGLLVSEDAGRTWQATTLPAKWILSLTAADDTRWQCGSCCAPARRRLRTGSGLA